MSDFEPSAVPHPGRRPIPGARVGYTVIVLASIAVVWASIIVHLWQEFDSATTAVEQETANLARGVAAYVERTLDAVDQTLITIRRGYARDPAGFDLSRWTGAGPIAGRNTFRFAVFDAEGNLRGATNGAAAGLAGRDLVRTQQGSSDDLLHIGLPTRDPMGQWTIDITRKIISPDGRYAGLVVCSVSVDTLSHLYERTDFGNLSVLVVGTDGGMRARYPQADLTNARILQGDSMAELLRPGVDHGSFRHRSPVDGVLRVGAFEYVPDYPLVVAVALGLDEVYAPFARHLLQLAGAGIVLSALITAVGLTMRSQHARLTRSQAALSGTLENIFQGIMMIEPDGTVPVINKRAAELLGLPPKLIRPGTRFAELVRWQVEQGEFGPPEKLNEIIRTTLTTGTPQLTASQFERRRPNGTVLEIRTEKTVTGSFVRTYTDVTDRKRTEEALAAARDAAEAAGRARSDFLAVMSHEIRTPMNGITGVAGLLLDMKLPATEQHYVRIILDSGQHLLQLINDILDFSRLDAGRLDLEETEFDIRDLAREVNELLGQEARAKGLVLEADIADDVPGRAIGDPHRLRQVLINLIGNGVKFTHQGSVRLAIRRLNDSAPGMLHLGFAVSDTGIGIAADALGRLFNEFTQVDSSISRRFGGSGLGLTISRGLIERMGGTINVESTEGVGSTFRFDVQLRAGSEPVSLPRAAEAAAPREPGLEVLVAEDNPTNRLVITRMLERLGHTVTAVENGREAVEAVQRTRYDFVLMDVMMPELDGLGATAEIRALPGEVANIPIIGLTANALRADEAQCLAAGMTHFETKPISSDRLADAIRRAVRLPAQGVIQAAVQPRAETPRFDAARLDQLALDIGVPATQEVVRQFCEDTLRQVTTMGDLAESGRLELLGHNARMLSRAAQNVGLLRVAAAAGVLVSQLEQGPTGSLREQVRQLSLILRGGIEELRSWRARSCGPDG